MKSLRYALAASFSCFVLLAGCQDDNGPTRPDPSGSSCGRLVVLTSDFATGNVTLIDADSSFAVQKDVASIHADAVARVFDGLVYVVNRFGGDNIQVLDPGEGFATRSQFSTGAGTNPHDIWVVAPDRAYIALFGSASLLEVDPRTGSARGEISLAPFADPDGIPDMDRLYYADPYLYISLERIDFGGASYQPVAPSMLAVLDTRTNELVDADATVEGVQAIALAGLNPIAPMVRDSVTGSLLVPEAGVYGVLDGGIERVDLVAMRSTGFLTTEAALGAEIIDFAVGASAGYAAVSDGATSSVISFDRVTGARGRTLHQSQRWVLLDLLLTPCGHLAVCDPDYETPGIRLYDAGTGEPLGGVEQPLATGLPPVEIVYLAP
jgi:hypothetical protein